MSDFKKTVYDQAIAAGFEPELAQLIADGCDNGDPEARAKAISNAREVEAICRICKKPSMTARFIAARFTVRQVKDAIRANLERGADVGMQILARERANNRSKK